MTGRHLEVTPGSLQPPPGSVPGTVMVVDVVKTLDGFMDLEARWEAVHRRDPNSGYFLSWKWMAEVLRAHPEGWIILAVRPEAQRDSYVCFLPLRVKERWSRSRRRVITQLEPAGRLSWGQYSGFLCEPEFERSALPALAGSLRELPWTTLTLKYHAEAERRTRLFLDGFDEREYRVEFPSSTINGGTVNSLICPFVQLPGDFETYLRSSVTRNTRQKIRRFFRKIDESDELRITVADQDTFDQDLEALLELWWKRWSIRRGPDTADEVANKYREILTQSFALNAVFLPVLWRGNTRLGALASISDRQARCLHFIVSGRDEDSAEQFIGVSLHAHSIRWAIENEFASYDFCHGNEAYKYSFGAVDRVVQHLRISRETG